MISVQHQLRFDSAMAEPAWPVAGPADAEWVARLEAVRQLIRTDPVDGGEQAAAAAEQARAHRRIDVLSQFTYLLGFSYMRRKEPVKAAAHYHQAISMARSLGHVELEAGYLASLGSALSRISDFAGAIDCYERALALQSRPPLSSQNHQRVQSRLLSSLGITLATMGMPEKAIPMFEQARAYDLLAGEDYYAASSLCNGAEAHIDCAERLSRSLSAEATAGIAALARDGLELAAQVVSDPVFLARDAVKLNARTIMVRARILLGDYAGAIEELDRIDHDLTGEAHGSFFRCDRRILRARLLRLTGRTVDAMAELQAEPLDDLPASDRVRVLEELVSAQEAAGDFAGALESFRQFHELTLRARDQATEQRGQVLNARLELERAQHKAEIERLRAEELTLRNEDLARQAIMDALTGLPNRRGLDAALAHRMGDGRSEFACVLADIDHFKRINDRYSHLVGDEVLRRVGALIRQALRNGDVAARYGGEEFALLLDRLEERQAVEVCERLRSTIAAQPWGQIADGLAVTISLGVAMRRAGDSSEALLGRADRCLYAAKAAGRDRVAVVAPAESEPPAPG